MRPSRMVSRNELGSSSADPEFVVRQLPPDCRAADSRSRGRRGTRTRQRRPRRRAPRPDDSPGADSLGHQRARTYQRPRALSMRNGRLDCRPSATTLSLAGDLARARTPRRNDGGHDHRGDPLRVARPADDRRVGGRGQGHARHAVARDPDGEPPRRDLPRRAGAGRRRDRGGPRPRSSPRSSGPRFTELHRDGDEGLRDHRQPVPADAAVAAAAPRARRDRGRREAGGDRVCEREGLPDVRLGHRAEDREGQPRAHGAPRDRRSTRTIRATPTTTSTSACRRAGLRCGCTERSRPAT